MDYIPRAISDSFTKRLQGKKVLVLLGARRVGKTEFIKEYLKNIQPDEMLLLNGDDAQHVELMREQSVTNYKRFLSGKSYLIIDEAQRIPEIGSKLKLIVDHFDKLKIVATGSSVFDLSNKLGEPLVGRKNTVMLYPLAQMELAKTEDFLETKARLEERLIFGSYPELLQYDNWDEKRVYLNGILNDYLLRDILGFEGIRRSGKILDLLRLIAFQIGKEVSIQELGKQLQMSKTTVERYLDLLTKVFVLYKLPGFSRNLRKEISKSQRWYFHDVGIRNAVINNFNHLNLRNDVGELWENYLIAERIKYQQYSNRFVRNYFWRTYDQQELDWVEEEYGELRAFEFKWQQKRKVKIPPAWVKTYPDTQHKIIHPDNYLEWIGG
ncbi:MAG: ATP-binding protein [Candidatus Marinimicrobia bacterium]|nr:ATP-binding protein [Candidatus Neomarinimicrobiota bacterium]